MVDEILFDLRTRVRAIGDEGGREGTVVDFGCDATPDCLNGEYCTTVRWDGDPISMFVDGLTIEAVPS